MDEGGPLAVTIELPQVGESVVEGTIGKWLKQPGDTIQRFEPLVEVVTDKVTMEIPSPVGGSLLKILAQEGETVPMGAPIAEVETSETPVPVTTNPVLEPIPEPEYTGGNHPKGTTGYLRHDIGPVGPTGGGISDPAALDADYAAQTAAEPPDGISAERLERLGRNSPAVRRLAVEHNVDLSQVSGTGMGGRITRDDVLKSIELDAPPPSQAARVGQPQPAQATAAPAAPIPAAADEEHIRLTPVRRMIADAMVRSVTEIPHAWSTVEVDVSGLVAFRDQVKADFLEREGVELTYLPFIIKAVVESLKEHPTLNASWGGDKIILKKRVNIGLAVAAPSGLIVPVIHDAGSLSVAGLAAASRALVRRARENKLTLEDVQGGTFTLNNTGALGSNVSQPIINYPQAAIMTTEAIQKRAVVRDDAIAIRSMMNLCMSFDHRINDGAESGGFMQAVKTRLEAIGPDTPVY
jgi:2-oxoisovalerate dehydrogenase E2 component (dihydrolipoyl transacylase)